MRGGGTFRLARARESSQDAAGLAILFGAADIIFGSYAAGLGTTP